MQLKSVLLAVKDVKASQKFYCGLFGLETELDSDGYIILSGGLCLQGENYWRAFLGREIMPKSNSCELYFEEADIDGFLARLDALYPETEFVNRRMTHTWGQTVTRFYDPDGHLIEVGTPV